jgi:ABC-2 type transport system ATP-binding protein
MLDCSVEAHDVSKRYGSVEALKGVGLTARPGDVHGLLGPNGAGKTTLLRVLLGLVPRDAGTVRLLGADLDAGPALPDAVAGFVETPAFYPYLSGRANLALLDRLDGQGRRDRRQRVSAVLDRTGLGSHADVAVGGYSAGLRQRLGLASALLRCPRLLLLDEPTSAIDAAGARDVRGMMQQLADDGAAIVFSSHDLDTVEQVCSTISVIDRGRMLFSGAIDELRAIAPDAAHLLRTSDDARALRMAAGAEGVRVTPGEDHSLLVRADEGALDRYVIALGCGGVAIRHLERRARSLESLFLELTGAPPTTPTPQAAPRGANDLSAAEP